MLFAVKDKLLFKELSVISQLEEHSPRITVSLTDLVSVQRKVPGTSVKHTKVLLAKLALTPETEEQSRDAAVTPLKEWR